MQHVKKSSDFLWWSDYYHWLKNLGMKPGGMIPLHTDYSRLSAAKRKEEKNKSECTYVKIPPHILAIWHKLEHFDWSVQIRHL